LSDRFTASLEAFIRQVFGQRLDYLTGYQAKSVKQNADGTLELVPDDSRLPSFSKVPIRYGVPGIAATVAAGARVLLAFAGGDPAKPIATVWESASVTALTVTATTVNVNGGTVNVGTGADAKIARYDDLKTAYDAHVHTSGGSGSPTSPPTVPLPTAVGASKGKVS